MKPLSMRSVCLPLLFCLCISLGFAHADIHYVSNTGSDTPPYASCDTAALSIQSAIDAASEGDTVLIGPDVFMGQVVLKSGLSLRGSGRDVTTILSGSGPVVTCLKANTVSIEQLTISGGHARDDGGGVYAAYCVGLQIRGCAIARNVAGRYGGGIYLENCVAVVIGGCTVNRNEAGRDSRGLGGGICAIGSEVTIENSVIDGNTAWYGAGGGIFLGCSGRVCKVGDCEIIGNRATEGRGGGIECYCLGKITDSIIANNLAGHDGGGIWCGETMGIWRCVISNNEAGTVQGYVASGGGIYYRGGPERGIVNCIVANNVTNHSGAGGMFSRGDGIFCEANINVVNCTLVFNAGEYSKGSTGIKVGYPAELYGTYENITNCIVCGNGPYDPLECRPTYSAIDARFAREGEGNVWEDPRFRVYATCEAESVERYGELDGNMSALICKERIGEDNQYRHMFAQRGLYTRGFFIAGNTGNELLCYGDIGEELAGAVFEITDLTLAEDSPCIDAGNNEAAHLPNEDKAGAFRIYPGKSEWRVDMGAYEFGSRRLEITAVERVAQPGYVKLSWNSQNLPGKTYSIYSSADLLTWTLGGSNIPSSGGSTSWVDPDAGAFVSRFYRVSSP